jgi:hypothetical protein
MDPLSVEQSHLTELLLRALEVRGFQARLVDGHALLDSGVHVDCDFLQAVVATDGSVRTSTRTLAWHESHFPEGVLEYQHSSGATLDGALQEGFASWSSMDLALLESIATDELDNCSSMQLELPDGEGGTLRRQVVFGNAAHLARAPVVAGEEEHPFCPCCLFTQSMEALKGSIAVDRFLGIRLFAMRNPEGIPEADCRINGEDAPEALPALRHYVSTWPQRGFEFRKQYVAVRTLGAT